MVFSDSLGVSAEFCAVVGVREQLQPAECRLRVCLDGEGRRITGLEMGQTDLWCGAMAEEKGNWIFFGGWQG